MSDSSSCRHESTEPVDVRDPESGQAVTVARICVDCYEQLPTGWGCPDCEWAEERRLCDLHPILMLARPCQEHA